MSDKAQPTPGPWEARTFLIRGGDKMRDTICHVGTSTSLGPPRVHETVANARLIAAAPDMLSALIDLVALHDSPTRPGDSYAAARAAIAKATGA